LLGGKAIACLIRTRDIFDDFQSKYGGNEGVISRRSKNPHLLAVCTSSSLGRSSLYNRLKINGVTYFHPIGYTTGWGHFHVSDDLFIDLREYVRAIGHPYADKHRFGQGPNWRFRVIRVAFASLGFRESLLRHGVRRQVFISELAENAAELLRSGDGIPSLGSLNSAADVSSAAVARWMIPRAVARPEFRAWTSDGIGRLLRPVDLLPERRSMGN
jgi:Domain of unknown function (DUF4338)